MLAKEIELEVVFILVITKFVRKINLKKLAKLQISSVINKRAYFTIGLSLCCVHLAFIY
jgi:hypothetical protein